MPVQVGSPAPTFSATAYVRDDDRFRDVALEQYKGRWLCLAFFPAAFSGVCPTEMIAFSDAAGEFDSRGCDFLACSCDTHHVHKAWCDHDERLAELRVPLVSDVTKRIAMDYGVLVPDKGVALRGTFLIDPEGTLRWTMVNEFIIGRGVSEILRVLDALQTDKPCPCDWKRGDETL